MNKKYCGIVFVCDKHQLQFHVSLLYLHLVFILSLSFFASQFYKYHTIYTLSPTTFIFHCSFTPNLPSFLVCSKKWEITMSTSHPGFASTPQMKSLLFISFKERQIFFLAIQMSSLILNSTHMILGNFMVHLYIHIHYSLLIYVSITKVRIYVERSVYV